MYYFASDVHLGLAYEQGDHTRERTFVAWLDSIKHDAKEI